MQETESSEKFTVYTNALFRIAKKLGGDGINYLDLASKIPALVLEMDCSGIIYYANEAVANFTGYAADYLLGCNLWYLFFPKSQRDEAESFRRIVESSDTSQLRCMLTLKNGEEKPYISTFRSSIKKIV